jgi:hypothetical protein
MNTGNTRFIFFCCYILLALIGFSTSAPAGTIHVDINDPDCVSVPGQPDPYCSDS